MVNSPPALACPMGMSSVRVRSVGTSRWRADSYLQDGRMSCPHSPFTRADPMQQPSSIGHTSWGTPRVQPNPRASSGVRFMWARRLTDVLRCTLASISQMPQGIVRESRTSPLVGDLWVSDSALVGIRVQDAATRSGAAYLRSKIIRLGTLAGPHRLDLTECDRHRPEWPRAAVPDDRPC